MFKLYRLLVIGAFLFISQAYGQEVDDRFTISDIRIEGLQRISSGTVFNVLPVNIGDTVGELDLRSALRGVFSTGNFEDVRIARDQNILVVQVVERPSISEINIEGNKAIKTEQLLDGLKSSGLHEGQVLLRATLEGMRKELLRQYVGQGRYDATIVTEVIQQPRNRVAVEITVDEGTVSRIKHINFIGNHQHSDEDLSDLMELRDSGWFLWMNGKNKYSKEKFESDISNIETFYFDEGYAQFRIIDAQVSISPNKKGVYLSISVDEGDKYTFGDIAFSGDLVLPVEQFEPFLESLEGEGFSQTTLSNYEESFTNAAGNIGYTFAEVSARMDIDDENKTVDVKFFIDPGKRTYVNRIDFKGHHKSKDEVLRREMRQLEMAPASNAKIEQGRVRLNRLGFFKEVEVDTQPTPGSDDLVDVVYTVEEQASGSISASLGYAQDSGLLVGANLQQNNFLGTGAQVGIGINTSDFQSSASFSYTNPYYTEDGVSRGFSVFYKETNFDEINVSSFSTDSYGVTMNFGYPLSELERLNFSLGYQNTDIQTGDFAVQEITSTPSALFDANFVNPLGGDLLLDGNGDIAALGSTPIVQNATPFVTNDPRLPFSADGFLDIHGSNFDIFSLNAGYIRSTLNRGVLATRGTQQRVNVELAAPGSDLEYYKVSYDGQVFVPLTQSFTMRFSTKIGFGDGYGDTEGLPFFENFYGGGFGSVRGFKSNTLGPQSTPARSFSIGIHDSSGDGAITDADDGVIQAFDAAGDPILDLNGDPTFASDGTSTSQVYFLNTDGTLSTRVLDDNDPFGGNLLVQGSAELIFPLPFVKDQRSLRSVFFLDAGNVFSTNCGVNQVACTNFDAGSLRYSVGFGLNWLTGFGPLSFSLGKALNPEDTDEREFFQFSLGQSF